MSLEQLLADWLSDAGVLRRQGQEPAAVALEAHVRDVKLAAEPYLTWLSESDAMLRSGRSREWLRGRFGEWERETNAKRLGGKRVYRMLVIPRRAQHQAAYQAGRKQGAA